MAENPSAKDELEGMVALYNEAGLGPDRELVVDLNVLPRQNGAIVHVILCIEGWKKPPILSWGYGADEDVACAMALKRFKAGSDTMRKYLPFEAGSLEELKLKLAVLKGEGRPA